jgi:hypothetical protein
LPDDQELTQEEKDFLLQLLQSLNVRVLAPDAEKTLSIVLSIKQKIL